MAACQVRRSHESQLVLAVTRQAESCQKPKKPQKACRANSAIEHVTAASRIVRTLQPGPDPHNYRRSSPSSITPMAAMYLFQAPGCVNSSHLVESSSQRCRRTSCCCGLILCCEQGRASPDCGRLWPSICWQGPGCPQQGFPQSTLLQTLQYCWSQPSNRLSCCVYAYVTYSCGSVRPPT